MKNIRAIIRKSGSVALASAMVLSGSGVMAYAATSDVQNTISAIEQSYGIDSAKYAQDISANVYEGTDEPQADTVSSGKWGTCDWNINDGVLTISGGVASGSVKNDSGYMVSPWDSYKRSIKKVVIEDTITFENNASLAHLFDDWLFLQEIDGLDKFDTSNVTDISYMFYGCYYLKTLDVSKFNTGNVTDMSHMFGGQYGYLNGMEKVTTIDVSNFDTSNVTSMCGMFYGCNSLTTIDISNFDTSNVKDMSYMFYGCDSLATIDVSNFDTSNVTRMEDMFYGCNSLTTIDLSNFDTSKVISMGSMFSGCKSLITMDVSNLDTSKVLDMLWMFKGCNSLSSLDLSNFKLNEYSLEDNKYQEYVTGFLPTKSKSLKQVILPSDLGTEDNIKIILDEMYTISSSWTDKTANKVYAEKPDTLIAGHTYVVTGSEYDKTELSINATKKENGNKITFTANANGGNGKYTYKFLVYNKTTNSWAKLQDFSDKNTFTWTKGNAGDRYFYVDVKDSTGKTVRSQALNVNTAGAVSKPTSSLTASTAKVNVGGKVTLTAKAGAGSGKYTYKFLIYNPSTNQWAKLQDFSTASKLTWKAGSAAERQFYVDVKDSNGTVVRCSVMNVKTTK